MRYEDFVVHIGGRRQDHYVVRVLQSPAGEGVGRFAPPLTPTEIGALYGRHRGGNGQTREGPIPSLGNLGVPEPEREPEPEASRDLVRRRRAVEVPSVQEAGQRLFDSIFQGQVARLYDRSLGQVEARGDVGLRLKLRLDSEALVDGGLEGLPWELMYREETGRFLGLDRRTSIVRYLDVPRPSKPIPLPERLRVLVAMAEPELPGLAPLDLLTESGRLYELSQEHESWQVEIAEGVSVGMLRRRLAEDGPFHVVHFMGHGGFDPASGEGLLYFQQPDRSPQPISGRDLAAKLIDFDDLGLVFLNACETANAVGSGGRDPFAGVASALVRGGLPAVIAMQRPISDRAALAFSDAFYRGLATGKCADEALVEGRQAIHSSLCRGAEWGIPVLFARVRDGAVFEAPEPEPEVGPLGRMQALWGAGLGMVLLLLLALTPLGGWLFAPESSGMELDQVFATSLDGVEGLLRRVEILADGTMRVHFEFTNGSDSEKKLGFDFGQTYLADEEGRPYEVIRTNAPLDAAALVRTLAPGQTQELWIDVPAPLDGARRFGVALAAGPESEVSYPFFEVELPEYDERLGRRSEEDPVPEGVERFQPDAVLASSLDRLDARLSRVEVLADKTMRWSLGMINRTRARLGVAFDLENLVLVDDLGNIYPAKGGGFFDGEQYFDGVGIRRGLRADPFFDFGPAKPGAKRFSLRLATKPTSDVSFEEAEIEIEGLAPPPEEAEPTPAPPPSRPPATEPAPAPPPPTPQPVASFELGEGEHEIRTTLPGLRAKLVSIDHLGNGRLRWHLEIYNQGGGSLAVGYDRGATKLIMGGDTYRLDATDAGEARRGEVRRTLAPGQVWRIWLEFAGSFEGDEAFDLLFGSADPGRYRYRLVAARLGEVARSEK